MAIVVRGESMALTPAASAAGASPLSSPRCARCAATSDDEHAVSVEMQGPDRPSVYATLRSHAILLGWFFCAHQAYPHSCVDHKQLQNKHEAQHVLHQLTTDAEVPTKCSSNLGSVQRLSVEQIRLAWLIHVIMVNCPPE